MAQEIFIARVFYLVKVNVELYFFLFPLALERENGLAHLLVEPECAGLEAYRLVVDLREQQDVPNKVGQAARVENDLIDIGVLLLIGQLTVLKQGSVALDGVYRRLELVGYVAYKIGL